MKKKQSEYDQILADWKEYHGGWDDEDIPDPPPAFIRGWRDGYAAWKKEKRLQAKCGRLSEKL